MAENRAWIFHGASVANLLKQNFMATKMTKTVACMMLGILSVAKPRTDKCKAGLSVVAQQCGISQHSYKL